MYIYGSGKIDRVQCTDRKEAGKGLATRDYVEGHYRLLDNGQPLNSGLIWLPRYLPMNRRVASEHSTRYIVRSNFGYLASELLVSNYLDALYEVEVLSVQEMENLRGVQNKREQTANFLAILMSKSDGSSLNS